ncbi:hypothetical protein JCM16303_004467 [Sporobolomyces ruberrimus]
MDLEDHVPAQPKTREAPSLLAARFKNLCRSSPEPSPDLPPRLATSPPPRSVQPHARPVHARPVPASPRPPAGYEPVPRSRASLDLERLAASSGMSKYERAHRNRASGVRSCDQCRTSKQKCDRNRPCANCSMRKVTCTWDQAGVVPTGPLATQVEANRAEIGRLRKEANTLAKLLRLTATEFDLFHAEAKRLTEGGTGAPIRLPGISGSKRSRSLEDHRHYVVESNKVRKRVDQLFVHRSRNHSPGRRSPVRAPLRPPVSSIRGTAGPERSDLQLAPIRPSTAPHDSSSSCVSPRGEAAIPRATSPSSIPTSTIVPRPEPRSRTSFSVLPPLKIPSLSLTRPPPLSARSQHNKPMTPSLASTTSPRRRPHYVLPTPVYSATPTSASFFPLSLSSSTTLKSLASASKPISISPLTRRYEAATPVRVQPYTPLSAVRDEKVAAKEEVEPKDQDSVEEGTEEKGEDGKAERENSPAFALPKIVRPSIKNLLNA